MVEHNVQMVLDQLFELWPKISQKLVKFMAAQIFDFVLKSATYHNNSKGNSKSLTKKLNFKIGSCKRLQSYKLI